jgi:murein DD-endopeptidase MepM/ murein hydrolase activator NlpD
MKAARFLAASVVLGLCLAPVRASADDQTPPPATAPPTVLVQPTPPPVAADTPVADAGTPAAESTPVSVSRETSPPIVKVNQPGTVVTTPSSAPQATEGTSSTFPSPFPSQVTGPSTTPPDQNGSAPAPAAPTISGPIAPPDTTSSPDAGVAATVFVPGAAAAPAQLTCGSKTHPLAAPFLVAPFSGWSEIVSFVDHDKPDYEQDGKIVIANGMTALASDGQASDLFPSYWSPALRQFLNYDGHNGFDFDLSYQPVLAAAAGTVEFAGWNSPDAYTGYGQMILINHHNGYVTLYGHLSKLEVKTGDRVRASEEIGISGSTGHSSGPHLHFSVFHDCNVTDPYGWTGRGQDPLFSFDGERAQYLWLAGRAPLILNPPPGWPVGAFGIHVPILGTAASAASSLAVDRLLLLDLPGTRPMRPTSPGVALAIVDARVSQEFEALTLALVRLEKSGLIQGFQMVRAAAAVWVRGTATAEELESLPAVASLSGVSNRDVMAAEAGLAHAVLTQIGQRQAPSLWPVGFRTALHAWQPTVYVLREHALVAGYALPGQQAHLSLHRNGAPVGGAVTLGDPQSGGFVATLHDPSGNPIGVERGDFMVIACEGHSSTIVIGQVTVRARLRVVSGQVPGPASVALATQSPDGTRSWSALVTASGRGQIAVRPPHALTAGSVAVASVVDDAGNQESAAAFVPGIIVAENGSEIHGWTVGRSPRIRITRRGRVLMWHTVPVESDGSFALAPMRNGKPLRLQPGDVVTFGSRLHPRTFIVPHLAISLKPAARSIGLTGPARGRILISISRQAGATLSRAGIFSPAGKSAVRLPWMIRPGDRISVSYGLPTGDEVVVSRAVTGSEVPRGSRH